MDEATASVTDSTGTGVTDDGATASDAAPDLPSEDAVMETVPALMEVTSPFDWTDAIVTSELVHTMERFESTAPFASFNVAVACVDCPASRVVALSATATDATGTPTFGDDAVTVIGTIAFRPSAF